jgi:hypothetical protein
MRRRAVMKNFYTVRDSKQEPIYGGESPREAVEFFRRNISARIAVSVWEGEGENLHLAIEPIDITPLVLNTIVSLSGGAK